MNFGVGFTFSKGPGFSEGPRVGPGQLYKVCHNKPLLQSETKIFKQKDFIEKLVRSQRIKKFGCFEIKSDNV